MNLKPIKNLILVERLIEENKTDAGIILTGENKKQTQYGIVMDIGPKVDTVSIGDTVFFNKYAGTNIGDIQVIMKEEDVIAVVTE